MAINDILGEARRFFVDVSQYFAAGQQVSKYEKVVEKLEKKIKSCQEKLDDAKAGALGQTAQYSSNAGSAQGELKTGYDAKVDTWDEKHQRILQRLSHTLVSARRALKEARSKVTYWEGVQEQEESSIRSRVWGKQEDERREKEKAKAGKK